MIRCPVNGNVLEELLNDVNSVASLIDVTGKNVYQKISGKPVLVNFENSILDKNDLLSSHAQSVISRGKSDNIMAKARGMFSRTSPACQSNTRILLDYAFGLGRRPLVLLIGGGTVGNGMQEFYDSPHIDLVSFDIYDSPNVQIIADAHDLPFAENTFDIVIIQAVLEHVLDPKRVVSQIHKVLRPSGWVYAETPFMQQVHEGAFDFTRFSERGHRYLFKNFENCASGATSGAGTSLLWALEHFFRSLFRSILVGKLVRMSCFWLQYVDDLLDKPSAEDAACAVYFLGKKSSNTLQPRSLIEGYSGGQ
ncbi:MAG: class I SAM-dependent methyltransferase [Gammaproteobacteria bacterium]